MVSVPRCGEPPTRRRKPRDAKSVTAVLGLGGSGVTMAEQGQLQFVTAVTPDS